MLTGSGRAVAVLALVLLPVGWLTGYPEIVVIGFAGLLALLVAAGWMLARPEVSVTREVSPQRVSEGESATAVLTLTNVGRRRCPPIVAVERVGDREVQVDVGTLAPGATETAPYALPGYPRGVYRVGPLTIGHADPLRLMRVARTYDSQTMLWVHPRVHEVEPLPTGRARDADGPTQDTAPRGGVAFHSLREFRPGDDRRLIHWRSSARRDTLMVRHHVVPNEPRLTLLLDTSAQPYEHTGGRCFDDAARVVASLAAAGFGRGYPVEVRTTGGATVALERGTGDLRAVFDLLAQVQCDPDDAGLPALLRMAPADDGVSLGVVTGQALAERLAAVTAVRNRYAMTTLVMVGEQHERPAPQLRGVLALNVATSEDFARAWAGLVRR